MLPGYEVAAMIGKEQAYNLRGRDMRAQPVFVPACLTDMVSCPGARCIVEAFHGAEP